MQIVIVTMTGPSTGLEYRLPFGPFSDLREIEKFLTQCQERSLSADVRPIFQPEQFQKELYGMVGRDAGLLAILSEKSLQANLTQCQRTFVG